MAASTSTINQLMVSPKHGVSVATINLTGLAGGTNMTEHSGSQKVNQSSGSHKKSELLGQLSPSMYPYGSSLQKLDESSNQVSISSS